MLAQPIECRTFPGVQDLEHLLIGGLIVHLLGQELAEWQSLLAGAQEQTATLAVEQAAVSELPAIALEGPSRDACPSLQVMAAETHRKMTMQVCLIQLHAVS